MQPKPENLASLIFLVRGEKVLLDADLAILYGVETRALNQAVARNIGRFPADFIFQLSADEYDEIQSRFLAADDDVNPNSSQTVMSSRKHRGRAYRPYAFTEQGVAMLSGILNSDKAIDVNIAIMRAFIALKQFALTNTELNNKLKELENTYNKQFKDVYEAINYLLQKDKQEANQKERKQIGYKTK